MVVAVVVGIDFTTLSIRTYFYCVLLALVCQVVGHSLFNWALKLLRANIVAIAVLGEPVGATLLAYLILEEAPGMTEITGGGFILAGIYLAFASNPDIMEPDAATGR
jgi:drug/metabolite transporter (DMT)-like permease